MSTFKIPDEFSLRYIPLPEVIPPNFNPGVGGEYATAPENLDQPIGLGAQVPDLWPRQKWWSGVPNENGYVQINFLSGVPIVEPVVGFTNASGDPDTSVTLTKTPSYYQFNYEGKTEGGQDIVTIRPLVGPSRIGVDVFVGVSKKSNKF
ncbi:hypothetical protein FRC07_009037 [Ceratobasidium sp. 392]|nr:hypothetical protein FRC07_009037 [Ceratobasidium sp. 392]